MCARGLAAGVCPDTIVCIVTGGRLGVATRRAVRAAGSCVAIQTLYRDQGATTWRTEQRATRPTTRPVHAATRLEGGHDTAPYMPRHGAQHAACARP